MTRQSISANQGFGLVEVLVALAVGLITTIVIMQVYISFEGQKRTTGGGNEGLVNGMVAMNTLSTELRSAGFGFGYNDALGCTVNAYNKNSTPVNFSFSLAPVTIVDGTSGAPDQISILGSGKTGISIPMRVTDKSGLKDTSAEVNVNSVVGVAEGDLLIAFEAGKPCSMFAVTDAQIKGSTQGGKVASADHVIHNSGQSDWNAPGGHNIFPQSPPYASDGYSQNALLFNLGQLIDRRFYISADRRSLMLDQRDTANNLASFTTSVLVNDIVDLQARYEKDSDGDGSVETFDTVVPSTSTDWSRLVAVRFAVVAQSSQYEKDEVTATAPSWTGGSFNLSNIPDWKHYRYRVFETVVPLRNMIWRQQ